MDEALPESGSGVGVVDIDFESEGCDEDVLFAWNEDMLHGESFSQLILYFLGIVCYKRKHKWYILRLHMISRTRWHADYRYIIIWLQSPFNISKTGFCIIDFIMDMKCLSHFANNPSWIKLDCQLQCFFLAKGTNWAEADIQVILVNNSPLSWQVVNVLYISL